MMHLKFEDMLMFVKVAEKLSFNKAANELNMPLSTLSRRIAAFEKALNIPLFERSTRKVILTNAGNEIRTYCNDIICRKNDLENFIEANYHHSSGALTVTASHATISLLSTEFIPQFIEKYPKITLILKSSTDTCTDLTNDILITSELPKNESLVAIKVGALKRGFFASTDYIYKNGTPKSLKELNQHNVLYVKNSANPSILNYYKELDVEKTISQSKKISFFDVYQAIEAAISGSGIVWAPKFIIENKIANGALQMLFDDSSMIEVPSYAVYQYRFIQPQKIISFVSELKIFISKKLEG